MYFKINLRLILVSGKTKEYLFSPSESAGDIAQFVFDNWPQEWEDEAVSDYIFNLFLPKNNKG